MSKLLSSKSVEICDVTLMSKEMINYSVTGIRLGLACTLAEFSLRSSAASSLLQKLLNNPFTDFIKQFNNS